MTSLSAQARDAKKANITIIATGGTIAGYAKHSKSPDEPEYTSAQIGINSITAAIPELSEIAKISTMQFSQIGSQDMTEELMIKLAKKVDEVLSGNTVDGVVITHGTDTTEESAYFINLTVKSRKPVVVVGSLRPTNALSADGPLNLFNAVAVASDKHSAGKGTLVVYNDEIIAARDGTKSNTTNVSAFNSGGMGAIGTVYFGRSKYYHIPSRRHTTESIFDIKKINKLPKVGIIYGYNVSQLGVIDQLIKEGVKGIVLAGVGNGNMSKELLEKFTELSKKGIIIVRSSRTGSGAVVRNAETDDDALGFVAADNLNPQKARILLMLALTKSNNCKKIQEIFDEF